MCNVAQATYPSWPSPMGPPGILVRHSFLAPFGPPPPDDKLTPHQWFDSTRGQCVFGEKRMGVGARACVCVCVCLCVRNHACEDARKMLYTDRFDCNPRDELEKQGVVHESLDWRSCWLRQVFRFCQFSDGFMKTSRHLGAPWPDTSRRTSDTSDTSGRPHEEEVRRVLVAGHS